MNQKEIIAQYIKWIWSQIAIAYYKGAMDNALWRVTMMRQLIRDESSKAIREVK